MGTLLSVRRPLLPNDEKRLRTRKPETNSLGNLGIRWRRLGSVGVTFVERGDYYRISNMKRSELAAIGATALAETINAHVMPNMPGRNNMLQANVVGVNYFGTGEIQSIAYMLDSPQLQDEFDYLVKDLDRRNGVNAWWGEFVPHVSVATLPIENKRQKILNAFESFAPAQLTLLPAIAQAT